MNIAHPQNHTILIIDDVPTNLAVVAEHLAQSGFQIKVAVTGGAGLKIAQRSYPDLILLDVMLPDLDGYKICRLLKGDIKTRDIPVIFMTAMTQTGDKVKGFEVGGVDYITKPVQSEEVLARVSTHLKLRDLTRDLAVANESLERRVEERTTELAMANDRLKAEIDERKNAQAALAQSAQEYRSLAENSPDNIIRYDRQCRAIYLNSTLARVLAIDNEELLGKTPMEFGFGGPQVSHEYERHIRQVLESGETSDMELLVPDLDKDKVPHHHLVRFAAERDTRRNITGVLAIGRDITVLKKNEEAVKHLNRELRALSDCNQVLVRAVDEKELLDEVCRIICDKAGYYLAWVAYAQNDADKPIRPAAWASIGGNEEFVGRLQALWNDPDYGRSLCGATLLNGEIDCVDFATCPGENSWHDVAVQFGFKSSIALPLQDENEHTFGALIIYSTEVNAFTPEEQRLLSELSDDLAFGIVNLRRGIEHDKAEEQIRIAATAFEAQEGILITDAQQKILRVNQAFTEITGYPAEEAIGATPRMLSSDRQDDTFYQRMWNAIQGNDSWQGEIWNCRKNGEVYPVWLNITAVKDPNDQVSHYVGTMTDITERKAAAAEIEYLAYHDPLTNLPNRRLLLDRLEQALASSARKQYRGALLFIDLDNFKILNDTRGHNVGDQLLLDVAQRLAHCVRKEDTISRFGGDEFMIMLNNLGANRRLAGEHSRDVAEKILNIIRQPYLIDGHEHHITPSVGITLFDGGEKSVHELMKQADIAMYQAKADGRNRLRFFDPEMQALLAKRATLEAALRRGVDEQQFFLHYQPQVDSVKGIIGAEILLRWKHPERGLVSPAEFIPLAEESGLILPIGQWVLESACNQLREWSKNPHTRELLLAVNVSQCQFRQDDFVDQVHRVLEVTGAPAMRLKIELTESLLIEDMEDSIKKMHALKAIGVKFSLDDFGTGYSSLSYLTRLPLEQLKIDMSFIRHLPDNHNDAVVVQTIITMAQSLRLTVIAEGVETELQRQFLEQHGCTTYQGFLFSKPVIRDDFEALLMSARDNGSSE